MSITSFDRFFLAENNHHFIKVKGAEAWFAGSPQPGGGGRKRTSTLVSRGGSLRQLRQRFRRVY
jgi:hypothetical protein